MPPRKKPSSTENINTFVLAFMGEYINIVTDIMIVEYTSNESQALEQNAPLVARGFLLDEDENYIFIGDNPLEIAQAIAKSRIVMLQIEKKKSKYEELLEDMGEPTKKDFN